MLVMAVLSRAPIVGVGLPVYNGERFLAKAVESVLCQTLTDFDLVISDNASTDYTPEICREFAAADPRVRYFRNEINQGALPNFNRVFELARGKYFKWAAHDDALMPEFLQSCVAALEAAPDAALCQSAIEYIDERGDTLGVHAHHVAGSESPDPVTRFAAIVLRPHDCYAQMGLLRRDLVGRAMPIGGYHGADRALLARIALAGRFIALPQPLIQVRDHAERYSRAQKNLRDRATWYDARNKGRLTFPVWRMYGSYWRATASARQPAGVRLRTGLSLLKWWFVNYNAIRMAVDIAGSVAPGVIDAAESVKQSVFSPAPGPGEVRKAQKR
jgi:glycosyltransferase involved in cell wall biosynthesis